MIQSGPEGGSGRSRASRVPPRAFRAAPSAASITTIPVAALSVSLPAPEATGALWRALASYMRQPASLAESPTRRASETPADTLSAVASAELVAAVRVVGMPPRATCEE